MNCPNVTEAALWLSPEDIPRAGEAKNSLPGPQMPSEGQKWGDLDLNPFLGDLHGRVTLSHLGSFSRSGMQVRL